MNAPAEPFLGVGRSVTGRLWQARPGSERTAQALSQRLGVPDVVGRVLAARGVDVDGGETFLNPTLRDAMAMAATSATGPSRCGHSWMSATACCW